MCHERCKAELPEKSKADSKKKRTDPENASGTNTTLPFQGTTNERFTRNMVCNGMVANGHRTNDLTTRSIRGIVVEKADESRVLRVLPNNNFNGRNLVPTPTKTSTLRMKKFSLKQPDIENSPPGLVGKLNKGGKKKESLRHRLLAPICSNLIADKKKKKNEIKNRRRSSLVCNKRSSFDISKKYNLRSKR